MVKPYKNTSYTEKNYNINNIQILKWSMMENPMKTLRFALIARKNFLNRW